MALLNVSNLKKMFGDELLFDKVSSKFYNLLENDKAFALEIIDRGYIEHFCYFDLYKVDNEVKEALFDKFQEFLETKTTIKPPLIYPDITDRSVSGYISAYLDKNGMFSHTFEKFSFNDDLKLSKTIKIIKYKEE